MSAEILREAAALMRSRAEAAVCPCGGPVCTIEHAGVRADEMAARFDDWSRVVDHYVGMSPAVALAVADWLEAEATRCVLVEQKINNRYGITVPASAHPQALIVATAYLGGDR